MTPALSIYLLAAARAEPLMAPRPREQATTEAATHPAARPAGELVWIHIGSGEPVESGTMLATRISDERPATSILLTSDEPREDSSEFTWLPRPPDFPQAVTSFLSAWAPRVAVWIGGPVWPVLAAKARQAQIPMLLVNATGALATSHRGVPSRELLGLFDRIEAQSDAGGKALERAARRPVAVTGRLQRSTRPLDYDEDEYLRVSSALQTRPVWYAARTTLREIEALRAAHATGQSASHRLLLIAQPADQDAASGLYERYTARRSIDRVPPAGAPVLVADVPGEEGLWYRLASVSFVGGTLGGPEAMVDPFAPAALGSAILHGPVVAPYAAHFESLDEANATRVIRDSAGLGRAVEDLLAPDRAAALAQRAWSVVSDGAEATDHIADEVARILDGTA